jgi:hypothetical protein
MPEPGMIVPVPEMAELFEEFEEFAARGRPLGPSPDVYCPRCDVFDIDEHEHGPPRVDED